MLQSNAICIGTACPVLSFAAMGMVATEVPKVGKGDGLGAEYRNSGVEVAARVIWLIDATSAACEMARVPTAAADVMVAAGRPTDANSTLIRSAVSSVATSLASCPSGTRMATSTPILGSNRRLGRLPSRTVRVMPSRPTPAAAAMTSLKARCMLALKSTRDIGRLKDSLTITFSGVERVTLVSCARSAVVFGGVGVEYWYGDAEEVATGRVA